MNNVTLGYSKPRAIAQLLQREKRLPNDPDLHKAYTVFMNDVLLGTAVIEVKNATNNFEYLRDLVDKGSQTTLVTKQAVNLLGRKRGKIHATINFVGNDKIYNSKHKTQLICDPRNSNKCQLVTEAVIISKITKTIPDND